MKILLILVCEAVAVLDYAVVAASAMEDEHDKNGGAK